MSINHLESWVWAQVGLEVVLLLLLAFFLVKIRAFDKFLENYRQEETSLRSALAQLTEQMAAWEEKQAQLEAAIHRLSDKRAGGHLKSAFLEAEGLRSGNSANPRPGKVSLRQQVETLHRQGFSPAEIAQHLDLHPTEVKMALDLSRLKGETP